MTQFGGEAHQVGMAICVPRTEQARSEESQALETAYRILAEHAGCVRQTIRHETVAEPFGCDDIKSGHDHIYVYGDYLTTDAPPRDALTDYCDSWGLTEYDMREFAGVLA